MNRNIVGNDVKFNDRLFFHSSTCRNKEISLMYDQFINRLNTLFCYLYFI